MPGGAARLLSHVELVYAPGERALVARAFELLGCSVRDRATTFLTIRATDDGSYTENVWYASEVSPQQWALELRLRELAADGPLTDELTAYADLVAHEPQRVGHFGIQYAQLADLEVALDRVRHVPETAPELVGRLHVARRFDPGDPGSLSDTIVQAFLRTSLFASGSLALGQVVELQHYVT